MKPIFALSALVGLFSSQAGAISISLEDARCWVDNHTTIRCENVQSNHKNYWVELNWSSAKDAFVPVDYGRNKPVKQIHLYAADGRHTGNLAGDASDARAAIDAKCASARPAGYSNHVALISLHREDPIYGFPRVHGVPDNLPVVAGPYETKIADDWADLVDGQIDFSLSDVGVTSDGWWSGSSSQGLWNYDSCSFWSSDDPYDQGHYGTSDATAAGWIDAGNNACSSELTLLCVAY